MSYETVEEWATRALAEDWREQERIAAFAMAHGARSITDATQRVAYRDRVAAGLSALAISCLGHWVAVADWDSPAYGLAELQDAGLVDPGRPEMVTDFGREIDRVLGVSRG